MRQPEDDGGGNGDGREEGVCTAVVAGVDAAPVFEPAEHDLALAALAIEYGVMRDADLAVGF